MPLHLISSPIVGRMKGRLAILIGVLFTLAVVSLIVDQNTGDTTGPPYHDSVLNHVAFFTFFATALVFVILVAVVLLRWGYKRLRATRSA